MILKDENKAKAEHLSELEELVEDRTLQVMMTNERLQNEIAERIHVEEELRSRNAELETFAHTISHDLRNTVSIIEGYAQAALEGREDLLQECLEKIVHLTRRMENFIESLLAYSEAGRPEGNPVAVDVSRTVNEIVMEREAEISGRNVKIVIEDNLPVVRVDPLRLQQVLTNLLDNALKYMGDNPAPVIECGARAGDGAEVFFVKDNGIGIDKGEHRVIFEPFQRLSSEYHHGLGIGLSTVRRAVEGWGGEVWVESTPGEGSTFFFTVPIGGAASLR
jgi:two-component system, chemotaxis family, sensor kinase Cph1